MIINQSNLSNMYVALNTIFNAAFQGAPSFYDRVAMVVPSNTRSNDYKFMLQFPMLAEWIGDRQIRSLAASNFELVNKDYEATIEVDRNDLEDDTLGVYNPIVAELGRAAKQHPDLLMAALMTAGFTATAYDGVTFFGAHDNGTNDGGGSAAGWYLLDTSRYIKPFIFQQRTMPQLVRQDKPDDEHAFNRKKFRYGVDYRGAAGYGLWQLCYGSQTALTSALYSAARETMMSYTNDEGVPLGIKPNLLVVPPVYEDIALEIVNSAMVIGDGTAGGSKSNIWQGSVELMVCPWLPNS